MIPASRPSEFAAARPVISKRSNELACLNMWEWIILEAISTRSESCLVPIVLLSTTAWACTAAQNHSIADCKNIFSRAPFLPSLDQMVVATKTQRLGIVDLEIIRGHYAETLKNWRKSFYSNIEDFCGHNTDIFIRIRNFFLRGYEHFFRLKHGIDLQLQLAHNRAAAPTNNQYVGSLG